MRTLRNQIWSCLRRRDEGWTFIEATFSVVLITIVFLGFTVILIAFREGLQRSWAIRVMDQYANDFISQLDSTMRLANNIWPNPPQYGLNSFSLSILQHNDYYQVIDSTVYTYSAHPQQGIFRAKSNTAPTPFDPVFTHEKWADDKHRFTIEDFLFSFPSATENRSVFFKESRI
ncbi:MAG: hypothetical protein ABH878_10455, partial [bacterium]